MQPLAISITEAARLGGVGRSTIYVEINNGNLKTCKIRNRRVVPIASLQEWLDAKSDDVT